MVSKHCKELVPDSNMLILGESSRFGFDASLFFKLRRRSMLGCGSCLNNSFLQGLSSFRHRVHARLGDWIQLFREQPISQPEMSITTYSHYPYRYNSSRQLPFMTSSSQLTTPHLSLLQLFLFLIHNKMNKNLKNTLRNKAIPRVKIVNHLEQGLSQHRQPFISYFDKIEGHRSYLNLGGGQVHQAQQITKTYQGSGSKGQFSKLPDLSPEIHINSRDRLQPVLTSILRKTTTGQTKTYPHHYSSFNQLTHSPSPTAIQTNNLQKQLQYMSYEEYQQLTAHGLVQPGHFSALARRNDLQKATPTNRNRRDLSLHQAIKEKQQNSAKIMPRASYKTRNQRLLTDVSTDKAEQSTIMNTKVGALSNMAIRQVLETQWMEQFKNKVMATAFTEQSEDKSEKDTKRIIIKDEINCSRKNRGQKRQSKLSQRQKQIRKLPVGKYRHIFQKIYQAEDLDLDRQKRAGRALSYAEQYSAHEEKLMHFNEVYRIRKGALKHKLDWKV